MRFNCWYLHFFLLIFIAAEARAQHEGFIYGEIKLKNKQIYTGQIRWSGGQMLWTDILLVAKQVNPNLRYLSEYQLKNLSKDGVEPVIDWKFMNLWKDKYPERKSEILSRFGDIALIHVTGLKEAQLYYKSGAKIRVTVDEQESRHLGKDIVVYNNELVNTIKWSAISTIRFFAGPSRLNHLKGNPLYGTVMTTKGAFSGFIQWDKMKYLDNQYLEGMLNGEKRMQYVFADIAAMERFNKGATVSLKSGKEVYLTDDRDVSAANGGIVVMHPQWGRVIVSWKAFRSLQLERVPDNIGYDAYASPKKIYATVSTRDKKIYKGNCVFDMDEEWNCDLMEGNKDGMYYQLPFKYISKMSPMGQSYSNVTLNDGRELILGHHNDVTAKNWGILVWQANSENKYIPWNMITEISFK
ncbi:hypothetical protein [Pedobacter heparinus]|uniref:hypothetical protein n=1 Tax=Pedobacter heparinus TaxID=984 RepID=UPI00292F9A62|nr:hypothetical protein [Pedobacter heparinus]